MPASLPHCPFGLSHRRAVNARRAPPVGGGEAASALKEAPAPGGRLSEDVRLRHSPWHLPALADDLWRRVLQVVEQPAQVRRLRGRRTVQVAGVCRFLEQADGTWKVVIADVGPVGAASRAADERAAAASAPRTVAWRAIPAQHIALIALPFRWHWLRHIGRLFATEVEAAWQARGCPAPQAAVEAYVEAAVEAMRRRLVRQTDLRGFRARVAEALDFPPDLLALARRQLQGLGSDPAVRLSDLNRVIRHRRAFTTLARELPQAVPLYGLLCEQPGFDGDAEPTAALRRHLLACGLSSRTWRLIVRCGPRLMLPLRHFYRGDAARAALDYLSILDALAPSQDPSGWPMWVLLSLVANPGYRHNQHHSELDFCLPDMAVALRRWQQAVGQGSARQPPSAGAKDGLAEVFGWLYRARPALDKRQKRAPWVWWLRSAREASTRDRLAAQSRDREPWPAPVEAAQIGGWAVVPLRDPLALWEEGRAMHHCIALREADCQASQVWAASIRCGHPAGRRVATALFEPTRLRASDDEPLSQPPARWVLRDVRAFANADPDPRLLRALQAWLATLAPDPNLGSGPTTPATPSAASPSAPAPPQGGALPGSRGPSAKPAIGPGMERDPQAQAV